MRMNKSHTSSTVCTMSPGIMSLLTLCHDTAHKHRGGKARIWILLSNFFFCILDLSSATLGSESIH